MPPSSSCLRCNLMTLWASAWSEARALGGEPVRCAGAAALQVLYLEWGRACEAAGGLRISDVTAELSGLAAALGEGTIELGVLDRPLLVTELVAKNLVQFPTAIGCVVAHRLPAGDRAGSAAAERSSAR